MGRSFGSAIELKPHATPANPPSGSVLLYFKTDGKLYKKTSAGVETEIGVTQAHTHVLTDLPEEWVKTSVRAATTANISLSGTQTIDTVALVAGDRVLVKDQASAAQNGIYIVAAGAWTRAADMAVGSQAGGATTKIEEGVQAGSAWTTTFKPALTVGTAAMAWYRILSTQDYPLLAGGTASAVQAVRGDDPRLSDTRTPTAHNHVLSDLPEAWIKMSVRISVNSATLSGLQTLDGVSLAAGDRVLVTTHTSPELSGIYVVSAGAWSRAPDADTSSKMSGATVNVDQGTRGGFQYMTDFKTTDTLGTTTVQWYLLLTSKQSALFGSGAELAATTEHSTTTPTPPATGIKIFARYRARRMAAMIGPQGLDVALQPALFSNRVGRLTAVSAATALVADGLTAALNYSNAPSTAGAVTSASFYASMARVRYASPASINGFAGFRMVPHLFLSSTANMGGFFWVLRFGQNAGNADGRGFAGLGSLNTGESNANPSTLLNRIGFGYNDVSTNWYFHSAGAGANASVTDLGANFPARTYATNFYEFRLFAPSGGGQSVFWSATRLNDNATVQGGPVTTNLPANGTLLGTHAWLNNGPTAAVVSSYDIQALYVETDN